MRRVRYHAHGGPEEQRRADQRQGQLEDHHGLHRGQLLAGFRRQDHETSGNPDGCNPGSFRDGGYSTPGT